MGVAQRLHPMLGTSENHRKVFPELLFIAFRRCKNLKDILVRSKLYSKDSGAYDRRGYTLCDTSRYQVCKVMCNTNTFKFQVTNKEYNINF